MRTGNVLLLECVERCFYALAIVFLGCRAEPRRRRFAKDVAREQSPAKKASERISLALYSPTSS